ERFVGRSVSEAGQYVVIRILDRRLGEETGKCLTKILRRMCEEYETYRVEWMTEMRGHIDYVMDVRMHMAVEEEEPTLAELAKIVDKRRIERAVIMLDETPIDVVLRRLDT